MKDNPKDEIFHPFFFYTFSICLLSVPFPFAIPSFYYPSSLANVNTFWRETYSKINGQKERKNVREWKRQRTETDRERAKRKRTQKVKNKIKFNVEKIEIVSC